MSRSKKRRLGPMDPAEAARLAHERRRNPEKWGADRDALRLSANQDVVFDLDAKRQVERARRYDVFALLNGRRRADGMRVLEREEFDAARELEQDVELRAGVGMADDIYNKTGGGGVPGSRALVDDIVLDAGLRVDRVLEVAGPMAAAVMTALLAPGAARSNWRHIVKRVAGEHRPEHQVAVVVEACVRVGAGYRTHRRERHVLEVEQLVGTLPVEAEAA
jgi:hypothetical protein